MWLALDKHCWLRAGPWLRVTQQGTCLSSAPPEPVFAPSPEESVPLHSRVQVTGLSTSFLVSGRGSVFSDRKHYDFASLVILEHSCLVCSVSWISLSDSFLILFVLFFFSFIDISRFEATLRFHVLIGKGKNQLGYSSGLLEMSVWSLEKFVKCHQIFRVNVFPNEGLTW